MPKSNNSATLCGTPAITLTQMRTRYVGFWKVEEITSYSSRFAIMFLSSTLSGESALPESAFFLGEAYLNYSCNLLWDLQLTVALFARGQLSVFFGGY